MRYYLQIIFQFILEGASRNIGIQFGSHLASFVQKSKKSLKSNPIKTLQHVEWNTACYKYLLRPTGLRHNFEFRPGTGL